MGVVVHGAEPVSAGKQRSTSDTSTRLNSATTAAIPSLPTVTTSIVANGDDTEKLETSSGPQAKIVISIEDYDSALGAPQLPVFFVRL